MVKGKKYWILLDSMPPLLKIDKKNSFFGTLLKDQRIIYWDQISTAFKKQIIDTGSLFGIKIIKK